MNLKYLNFLYCFPLTSLVNWAGTAALSFRVFVFFALRQKFFPGTSLFLLVKTFVSLKEIKFSSQTQIMPFRSLFAALKRLFWTLLLGFHWFLSNVCFHLLNIESISIAFRFHSFRFQTKTRIFRLVCCWSLKTLQYLVQLFQVEDFIVYSFKSCPYVDVLCRYLRNILFCFWTSFQCNFQDFIALNIHLIYMIPCFLLELCAF